MSDVFISYARQEIDFVRNLHDVLGQKGLDTWVDWEGIPPSAAWLEEIRNAIQAADGFVYVISPDSVASEICRIELLEAARQNKRLVPVVRHDVVPEAVEECVAQLNWIFFRESDNFNQALDSLVNALTTDLEWVKAHTRLLVRAGEWEAKGRDSSLLLRGNELKTAEASLARSAGQDPAPTSLQRDYVAKSRKAADRRRAIALGVSFVALGVALVLGVIALQQREGKERERRIAFAKSLAAQADLMSEQMTNRPKLRAFLALEAVRRLNDLGALDAESLTVLRATGSMLTRQRGTLAFQGQLKELRFSADGLYLTGLDLDGRAHFWNTEDWQKTVSKSARRWMRSVAVTADGDFLGAGITNDEALVVDLTRGRKLARFFHNDEPIPEDVRLGKEEYRRHVTGLALSPDGRFLATGGYATLRLWELAEGREIVRKVLIEQSVGLVNEIVFAPHGDHVAAQAQGRVFLFEVPSGRLRVRWALGGPMAVAPNGSHLALASGKEIHLRETASGRLVPRRMNHEADVRSLAFDPKGRFLVSGGLDRTARIWRVRNGEELARIAYHDEVVAVAFGGSGQTVALGGTGHAIHLHGSGANLAVRSFNHGAEVRSIAFTPDARILVTGGADNNARLWDMKTGKPLSKVEQDYAVNHLAVSPDGLRLASAGLKTGWLWRLPDGEAITKMQHDGIILMIAFSLDGRFLATADHHPYAVLWNISERRRRRIKHRQILRGLAFSPDGKYLATASGTQVRLWDLSSGKVKRRFEHDKEIETFAFSPDGMQLVSGGLDEKAVVWDTMNGEVLFRIEHDGPVKNVRLDATGRFLAVAGTGQSFSVWEWRTGRKSMSAAHDGELTAMVFAPDGPYLATVGKDRMARVWHVESGREVPRLPHDQQVNTLSFDPAGRYLATAGTDGVARLWLWRARDLVAVLCSVLSEPGLSEQDWAEFFDDEPYRATCQDFPEDRHTAGKRGP